MASSASGDTAASGAARRLGAVGVATVADATGGRGVVDGEISPQVQGASVAAPAYPVQLPSGDNLGIHLALADAPPESVIVAAVEQSDRPVALWGAIASAAARQRGLRGFVTNGFIRDRASLQRDDFPVFARGACPRRATKQDAGRHGSPVVLGGVTITRGDIVCADADGIVVVPVENAEAVAQAAEALTDDERRVVDAIAHGRTTVEALGLSTEVARETT